MKVTSETLENNMAKLTIEVEPEKLDEAIEQAYQRQKGRINVPGFRKGKVPRKMVEKMYGAEVFYDDAANILISKVYPEAYDESGLEIVSQPDVEVVQVEAGKPFIFTAEVATKPEVKLGKYEGVTVTKIDVKPTDEEIENEIKRRLEQNGRTITVERPIEDGDTAVIDFDGSVDGVHFDGGKGTDYNLKIGSHSFIDNFEEQLIGHSAGENVDVNVTFPEDYQEKSLAGKAALFEVVVKEVKTREVPELDDEFVQDTTEYDTVDDYKKFITETIEERKKNQARREQEDEALEKIIADSKMDIPKPMLDTQVNTMINNYASQLAQSGLSIQQYMQMTGSSIDSLRNQMEPEAERRIQSSLVLEAIAADKGLEVSDEEIDKKIDDMAANYGMKGEDLKKGMQEDERKSIRREALMEKALDVIMDSVKEKKASKKKEEAEV